MTTDINTVPVRRAMACPQLMPAPGSVPARDRNQSDPPQSHPDGGADLSRPAPPASREGTPARRTLRRTRSSLPDSLLAASLGELFWRKPDFDHLAEIEQRITHVIDAGKPPAGGTPNAPTPEPTQLFDELYDLAAC